jgi:PAS domain S-box-containing protein
MVEQVGRWTAGTSRRRQKGRRFWGFLCLIAVVATAGAQPNLEEEQTPVPLADATYIGELHETWRWSRFTTESGLPSNHVYRVAETTNGTVWAATDRGLAWFDGYQWHPMGEADGIPAGRANSIQPCGEGQILAHLAENGIFLGDAKGFRRVELPAGYEGRLIDSAAAERDGTIWVLPRSQERKVLLRENGVWREIDPPYADNGSSARALLSSDAGTPWLGTRRGSFRWANGAWQQRLESPSGRTWIAGIREGASGEGIGVRRYYGTATDVFEWGREGATRRVLRMADPQLTTIAMHQSGEAIVVSASGQAYVRLEGVWGEVSPLPSELRSPLDTQYTANGDLWVGSRDGLRRFRRGPGRWEYWRHGDDRVWNEVLEICPVRDGSIWIGTGGGLIIRRADGSSHAVRQIGDEPIRVVSGIAQDAEGNIWIGSGSGFLGAYRWDGTGWKHFGPAEGLRTQYIHKIRIDHQGRPWFLCMSEHQGGSAEEPGAFVLDQGRFQRWGVEEGLPNGRMYGFAESSDGAYWFASSGGLSRWHENSWRHWDASTGLVVDRVFTLAIDGEGQVWFGDQLHGLGRIGSDGEVRYYTTSDGLPSNRVWDLRFGPSERLWVATGDGVACLDDGTWSMFTAANGLNNPLVMCVQPDAWRVLAGTGGSGTAVMNLEPGSEPSAPRIVVHEPTVGSCGLRASWDVYAHQGVSRQSGLKSRYRLDGGDWSEWTTDQQATFADIAYGAHDLEVMARGPGGFLETATVTQVLRYRRPLHRRPAVVVPLALAFLGLTAFAGVQMTRRRRAREALRTTERRYQGLAEFASTYLYIASVDQEGNTHLDWASAGFKTIYGWTVEEYNADGGWRSRAHPDDREAAEDQRRRLLRGESTDAETRVVRPDGEVRWLHVASRPEFDSSAGRVVRIFGAVRDISEQKEAQEALRESERRLATLLSNLPGMAYRCLADRDWTMLVVSGNAEELTGYSPEDLQGSKRVAYAGLIHSDDRAMVERLVNEALEQGSEFELVYRIQTASGEEKWVWERGRVVSEEGVEPVVLEGFIEDITERRRAEEAARDTEEYFRALFEQAPAGIGVTAKDGSILAWNPAVLEMLGLTPEQAAELNAEELYADPGERQTVLEAFARDGEVREWESRFRRGDGSVVWLTLTLVPIHWRGMDVLLATLINIDQRRRAEETVRRSEMQFRALFERLPVGIGLASADGEGGVLSCNQAVLDMLGYESSEVEGHPVESFYVDPAEAQRLFKEYCEAGQVEGHEVGLLAADGSTVWVNLTMVPFDWDGRNVILSTLVDVSTRRQAEEQSRQSQERMLRAEKVARIGNWEWDLRTDAVNWSEGMYRVTGIDPKKSPVNADLVRTQVVHPEYMEVWDREIATTCETGGRLDVEVQCLRPDGELYWLHHEAEVVKDESGELVQMFGIAQDITDRKQAEERRRLAAERLELTLECANVGAWSVDCVSDRLEPDERTAGMLGYSPSEIDPSGQLWLTRVHPEDRSGVEEAVRAHLAEETPLFRTEHRLRTKSGDWKWVLHTGRVVERDAQGTPLRALGINMDIDDQKAVEQRLRQSEEKMTSIFRAAPIGLGVVTNRVLLDVNERLCELTGYSQEELIGQTARMLYPSDEDFEYVGAEKYRQIQEGGTGTVETRFRRKDGTIIDVLLSSTPFDRDDLVHGVTFTALDITERNLAARELASTKRMLEAAIAQSPAGIIIADAPDVTIRVANQAAFGVRGGVPGLLMDIDLEQHSQRWRVHRPDGTEYPPEELPLSRAVMLGEISQGEEFYILDDNDEKHWAIANAAPIRDSEGKIVAGIVVFPEITERKQAEEALQQSEEKLRYIVEHSTNMFFSHTSEHELTYASPQSTEILGCPPEEAMVRWTEFATDHPVNLHGFDLTQRAIDTGERQEPYELQLCTRDGRITWVEVHEAPVVVDGKTTAIVGALTDVTERHKAFEQLQRQAELERMLRRELDHRVRNNLTSLIALIDLGAQSTTDVEKLAASMRSRVNAMAAVHSLLSDEQWRPVDLKTILQRALTAEDSSRFALDGPDISVVPERVQAFIMVINELATNSRKYGALSIGEGSVSLIWSLEQREDETVLRLHWREEGGPTIVGDPELGVGLQLVKGLIERELGGGVELDFSPRGVRHTLWIRLDP